jgi:hypothetical protein
LVTRDKLDLTLFLGVDVVVRAGEEKKVLVMVSLERLLFLECLSMDLGLRVSGMVWGIYEGM